MLMHSQASLISREAFETDRLTDWDPSLPSSISSRCLTQSKLALGPSLQGMIALPRCLPPSKEVCLRTAVPWKASSLPEAQASNKKQGTGKPEPRPQAPAEPLSQQSSSPRVRRVAPWCTWDTPLKPEGFGAMMALESSAPRNCTVQLVLHAAVRCENELVAALRP